jgi:hypothetical protein
MVKLRTFEDVNVPDALVRYCTERLSLTYGALFGRV